MLHPKAMPKMVSKISHLFFAREYLAGLSLLGLGAMMSDAWAELIAV
jgi:hypothetical protein